MTLFRIGRYAAAAAAAFVLTFSAVPVWGAEVIGGGAQPAANRDAVTGPGVIGTPASGRRITEELKNQTKIVTPDTDVPENTGIYGYTREDALALADAILGFEEDGASKEIAVSYLLNQIWYDPQNLMVGDTGEHVLMLYCGPMADYEKSYREALDGLEFFSNPIVMFLEDASGSLIVGVQTGERFTEQQAAANYAGAQKLLAVLQDVKAKTSGMEQGDTAKFICDYVAGLFNYDATFDCNAIGPAMTTGRTACVGYNALTELLFRHAGMRYCSIVAKEKGGDMEHIFGCAEVSGHWLVFDTTNYDRDGSRDPFWIFSDRYREGMFYQDFSLVGELTDVRL